MLSCLCISKGVIILFPIPVAHIEYSCDSCDRYREYDAEDATDRPSCEHHDKYEDWREIEGLAHHLWYEEVILDLLYRDIEEYDDECDLP